LVNELKGGKVSKEKGGNRREGEPRKRMNWDGGGGIVWQQMACVGHNSTVGKGGGQETANNR